MTNDQAWEKIFSDHNLLDQISQNSQYIISTKLINNYKESRLMAKIDHRNKLPKIFKKNSLSILPISRQEYIIGYFDIHFSIEYEIRGELISKFLPEELNNFETFEYENLSSETAAINVAYHTGMIDDLLGEQSLQTVSGRMSTGSFSFNIDNLQSHDHYQINVDKSQCEIDGGFESESYFAIIEAKNYTIDDFCIRQLYYPYRLWSEKLSKRIIPVIMTYSNNIFSFFKFEFTEKENFNSLKLIEQKHFIIDVQTINFDDIDQLINKANFISSPKNIPFPQADKFERVIDLLNLLLQKEMTKEEITEYYQFDKRQTDYYTNAALYLGIIRKQQSYFYLTDETINILNSSYKKRTLYLIKKILNYKTFYQSFKLLKKGDIPSVEDIFSILKINENQYKDSTLRRRARTVRSWIDWICDQIND